MTLMLVGTRSAQTAATLETLIARGVVPDELFVDGPGTPAGQREIPLQITNDGSNGVMELAARQGLPVHSGPLDKLRKLVSERQPSRVLVSCYPHRIDSALLDEVPLGWLNIHPSRLPDYRGSSPIFWQLREGRSVIGVTLHRMNRRLDEGPIIAQQDLALDDYPDYLTICRRAGVAGAVLFVESLPGLQRSELQEQPQETGAGSRQPAPRAEDFAIDTAWTVEHLLRFVRGVSGLSRPFLDTPGQRLEILSIRPVRENNPMDRGGGERQVRCYDGSVVITYEKG